VTEIVGMCRRTSGCYYYKQGPPLGLKMWTYNRWDAQRAWGRWYV